MQITSIEKCKKNKDRLSVYIDERFAFTVSEEDYLSMHLYDKHEITEEEVEYIRNTLNFRSAKTLALRYLTVKLRTEGEVLNKLKGEGYDEETALLAIAELRALGYLNNRLYIQKYIYDRSKLKPISKKLLKLELLNKGMQEDEVDEVLEDWKVDESLVAEGLVRKKFGKYDLNDENVLKKAYSFLRHRGFSHELVMDILENIKKEAE